MKYSLINHWGAGWSVVRSNIFTAAFKQANKLVLVLPDGFAAGQGIKDGDNNVLWSERRENVEGELRSWWIFILSEQDCWWTRGTAHFWWCSSERRSRGTGTFPSLQVIFWRFLLRQKVPNLLCRARMCSNHVYWKNFGLCWMLSL